jgi:hypothetical protein
MNAVLKSIFHNGISPSEEIVPKAPEYRAVNRKIGEEERYFVQKLPPEDEERLEGLENLMSESASLYACECFAYGFRLGASLAGEFIHAKNSG